MDKLYNPACGSNHPVALEYPTSISVEFALDPVGSQLLHRDEIGLELGHVQNIVEENIAASTLRNPLNQLARTNTFGGRLLAVRKVHILFQGSIYTHKVVQICTHMRRGTGIDYSHVTSAILLQCHEKEILVVVLGVILASSLCLVQQASCGRNSFCGLAFCKNGRSTPSCASGGQP